MTRKIELNPVTRIEGHLAIHTEGEAVVGRTGKEVVRIVRATCRGEMFRGFETLLEGREPLDAQQIVQRICGICFLAHGLASIRAQEMAYRILPSPNGRLLQNLILAGNTLHSHLLHFYQFVVPDFVDVQAVLKYAGREESLRGLKAWLSAAMARSGEGRETFPGAPLLPRFAARYLPDPDLNCTLLSHYAEALQMCRLAHEMAAVFAGRMPHSTSIVPGGCTQTPTEERISACRARLGRLTEFVERAVLSDVAAIAGAFPEYWHIGAGYGHLLCFGSFETDDAGHRLLEPGVLVGGKWEPLDAPSIAEEVGSSWFSSPSKLHPSRGRTQADPGKANAYSWLKAPRYRGLPMEVGPLARILVNHRAPRPWSGRQEVDRLLSRLGVAPERLVSVLGRIACRALETVLIARQAHQWLEQLDPAGPPARDFQRVKEAAGYGLIEAPRGALGHWLSIHNGKIARYQCISPTAWNCSPRDDAGQPGPVEKALEGLEVADPAQPVEAGRVVRSFDPCMACAVH